jgi:hypothetical protein
MLFLQSPILGHFSSLELTGISAQIGVNQSTWLNTPSTKSLVFISFESVASITEFPLKAIEGNDDQKMGSKQDYFAYGKSGFSFSYREAVLSANYPQSKGQEKRSNSQLEAIFEGCCRREGFLLACVKA